MDLAAQGRARGCIEGFPRGSRSRACCSRPASCHEPRTSPPHATFHHRRSSRGWRTARRPGTTPRRRKAACARLPGLGDPRLADDRDAHAPPPRPGPPRSSLRPRARRPGDSHLPVSLVADPCRIAAAVAGTVRSIGFLGPQRGHGPKPRSGIPDAFATRAVVVLALAGTRTVSAVPGALKGIQVLLHAHVILALGISASVLVVVPTAFILHGFAGVWAFAPRTSSTSRRSAVDARSAPSGPRFRCSRLTGRTPRSSSSAAPASRRSTSPGAISGSFRGIDLPVELLAITQSLPIWIRAVAPAPVPTMIPVATTGGSVSFATATGMPVDEPLVPLRGFRGIASGIVALVPIQSDIGGSQGFVVVAAVLGSRVMPRLPWDASRSCRGAAAPGTAPDGSRPAVLGPPHRSAPRSEEIRRTFPSGSRPRRRPSPRPGSWGCPA